MKDFWFWTDSYTFPVHFVWKKNDDNIENVSEDEGVDGETEAKINGKKLRKKSRVIRYFRYNQHKDSLNYYREQCLLYMPWRNETEDIEKQDVKQLCRDNSELIATNREKYNKMTDEQLQLLQDDLNDMETNVRKVDDANVIPSEKSKPTGDAPEMNFDVDIFDQVGDKNNKKKKEKADSSTYFCPERVPEGFLMNMMYVLDKRQREFVMHILHCVKTGKNLPLHLFLCGGAGAGKSMVIRTLYQLLARYYDNMPGQNKANISVLLRAAFLISGTTLHEAFKFPRDDYGGPMYSLSDDELNSRQTLLIDLNFFIINEISMVSARMLQYLDARLKQIFGKNNDFGGVSIMLVGNLNQLPPVKGTAIFKVPVNKNEPNLNAFAGTYLWNLFTAFVLTQIMRQGDELDFIMALNNLATGTMTEQQIDLIRSRIVNEADVPNDVIRLYAVNAAVDRFNESRI